MTQIEKTSRRRWSIAAAVMAWLCVLFLPGIVRLVSFVTRTNPLRMDHVQVSVPRRWTVAINGGLIIAKKGGCLVVFCSSEPDSKMTLTWNPRPRKYPEFFQRLDENALSEIGLTEQNVRSFQGAEGVVECIEARRPGSRTGLISTCHAFGGELDADFGGDAKDVGAFYETVRSATRRR